VDSWAAGQWLTCDDNMAYVSGGVSSSTGFGWSQPEALRRPSSAFLQWRPATDNVLAHMFRDGPRLVVTVEFWREEHLRCHPERAGTVFAAEIMAEELAGALRGAAGALG
jgi:hypothetical protein